VVVEVVVVVSDGAHVEPLPVSGSKGPAEQGAPTFLTAGAWWFEAWLYVYVRHSSALRLRIATTMGHPARGQQSGALSFSSLQVRGGLNRFYV
jgi:hypothetical protein